jgi:serine/threonine protein kinase
MVSAIGPDEVGQYKLLGTIGEGAFSVVRLAHDEERDMFYACKIIPRARLAMHNLEMRFECEIRINQQLHHPGVVQLIDLLKDDLHYYVIMEFCPGGELFGYIVLSGRLTEHDAIIFTRQILESLEFVHSVGVCHRDLKPENILLDLEGHVKISDFGLSRFVTVDGLVSTPCGSPCYASPECISGKLYDGRKSDVWSVGVIVFAMLTGQLPWTKRNQPQLFEQIRKGEFVIPGYLSAQCRNFIEGLMTVDTDKRFTLGLAMKHPWLQCHDAISPDAGYSVGPSLKSVDMFFDREVSSKSLDGAEMGFLRSSSDTYNIDHLQNWLMPNLNRNFTSVRKTCSGKIIRYKFLDRRAFWTSGS